MEVYYGVILIADISLAIAVDSGTQEIPTEPKTFLHAHPFRKIFASYSHKDLGIVRQFEVYVRAFGDEFVRDWTHLRVGEIWSERLQEMITDADVFQLFWSTNSMTSDFVREEWQHALSLRRPSFIRPVYWEVPMPESPDRNLPPDGLRTLHFHCISVERRRGARMPPFDTDFEVDVALSDSDSDDKTVQLEAASDFDLEDNDTGSEVFAIDEEAVDQNASAAMAPSAFAEDDEDEEDEGFDSAVSSEMGAWSSTEGAASPDRAAPAMVMRREAGAAPPTLKDGCVAVAVVVGLGLLAWLVVMIVNWLSS